MDSILGIRVAEVLASARVEITERLVLQGFWVEMGFFVNLTAHRLPQGIPGPVCGMVDTYVSTGHIPAQRLHVRFRSCFQRTHA